MVFLLLTGLTLVCTEINPVIIVVTGAVTEGTLK